MPFGANFVLSDKRYLNLFDPKVYNKAVYVHGLAALEGLGFNIVKVFLPMGEVLPDPQAPGEARIAPGYLDNLEDFLRCAGGHHIRVVVSLADWGGSGLKWWREGGEYFGRHPWRADAGIDSIDVLGHFWAQVCGRLRDNPVVFSYTPAVEWTFPNDNLTWMPPDKQYGRLETDAGVFYWRALYRRATTARLPSSTAPTALLTRASALFRWLITPMTSSKSATLIRKPRSWIIRTSGSGPRAAT